VEDRIAIQFVWFAMVRNDRVAGNNDQHSPKATTSQGRFTPPYAAFHIRSRKDVAQNSEKIAWSLGCEQMCSEEETVFVALRLCAHLPTGYGRHKTNITVRTL
jgi:hypothetical protein